MVKYLYPSFTKDEYGDPTINEYGITLRDHFATQIIAGASANGDWKSYTAYKLASKAYEIADAMMEARKK